MLDCNKSLTVSVHICILQVIQALSGGVADGAAGHVSVSVQDVGSLLQICTVWYGLDSFPWIFMLVPVKKVADRCRICNFVRARRQEAAVLFFRCSRQRTGPKGSSRSKTSKQAATKRSVPPNCTPSRGSSSCAVARQEAKLSLIILFLFPLQWSSGFCGSLPC